MRPWAGLDARAYEPLHPGEQAGKILLNLIFPPRCAICDAVLDPSEREKVLSAGRSIHEISLWGVCRNCRKKLPWIREPVCKRCGKPLRSGEMEYCPVCERRERLFAQGKAVFLYEGDFRESVHRMKFENRREYLDFYADAMALAGTRYLRVRRPDLLLPVPMNRRKRRERGFDQSRILAQKLSRRTGIPCDADLLIRQRYTLPSKDLDARARQRNLQGAFAVSGSGEIPERVMLVDDIYTTGATIEEACRTLRAAGVREVDFYVLCTGRLW